MLLEIDPSFYTTSLPGWLQLNVKIRVAEPQAYTLSSVMFSELPECLSSIIIHQVVWW